jgi:hypothetical protein
MKVFVYGPKPGVGTTTVACGLAVLASETGQTLLSDSSQSRDALACFGAIEPSKAFANISESLDSYVNGWQATDYVQDENGEFELTFHGFEQHYEHLIVDGGTVDEHQALLMRGLGYVTVMVVANCYLSLRKAIGHQPDWIVAVIEDARPLRFEDVASFASTDFHRAEGGRGEERCVRLARDPAVARTVDAGLLSARLPAPLSKALRPLHASISNLTAERP